MKLFLQTPQWNGICALSTGRLRVDGSGARILGIIMLIWEDFSACKLSLLAAARFRMRHRE